MAANRETPARDPPQPAAQTELMSESPRTRVTRLLPPERGGIRKEVRGPDRERRLQHERSILERLSGVPGVVQLAGSQPYPGSILLEDVGGASLAGAPMPLDVAEVTHLALGLARVVAAVHARGVVHRDINPANIVVAGQPRAVFLIDFALAMTVAELRPEFTHHNETVGTLPYLAPEQTGRTGRPVDQRADLYAVGATLYELATGGPPFGSGDPLTLSHDHLTRVPIPPREANPAVSPVLSDIIMHLLEKEPDDRYQTAEGLVLDLKRLTAAGPTGLRASFRVGEHDFPIRLRPPSRLVGRDAEIAALGAAFDGASSGQRRGVLVSGAPGVGKSSLIDELRSIVTANDGWFVAGKFDQYRRDQEFDGVRQALRGLGRLLLAEPEEELAELRERLLRALGPNAGLTAALLPEFATLLQVTPDPTAGDPLTAQARAQRSGVEVLRVIASRKRPIVFVVDDLQWAGRTPLGLVDLVLGDEALDGLLFVGAYREGDVDATHPLTAMLSRWRQQKVEPVQIRLDNLPTTSVAILSADILRLNHQRATELAEAIAPRTKGNPFDTVELLNALRTDGVLVPGDGEWRWDPVVLRHRLEQADVAGVLRARFDTLPQRTQELAAAMACLGGRVQVSVLQAATGLSAARMEQRLASALDDGLLVVEPGGQQALRFRHDRVQEVILAGLPSQRRRALRLRLARRLAELPELFAVAAEQYLRVVSAVRDPDERRRVGSLLSSAADEARLLSNHPVVERCLAAAVQLIDPADTAALIETQTRRHTALYSLGRLDEADEVYRTIQRLCTHPLELVEATLVQVSSLANRNWPEEAVDLGLNLLRQLGCDAPVLARLDAEIDERLDALYRWVDEDDAAGDLRRAEMTDEVQLARGALINRLMTPTYFCDQAMMAWLVLEAARMWAQSGPGRTLVGPISHTTLVTLARRDDYRTGQRVLLRILAASEARGYQPDTSQCRFQYAVSTGHWFGPLEEAVRQAQQAREGLIHGGDLQNACNTYYATVPFLLDCAPSLDAYAAEIDAAIAFTRRIGNEQAADSYDVFRRLVRVLRGEGRGSAFDDMAASETYRGNPVAMGNLHIARALVAAVFNDPSELSRHTAAAMSSLPAMVTFYPTAIAHLLRALSLAGQIRAAAAAERSALLAELDIVTDWLASRAVDAPVNLQHLLRLAEAERAWSVGDFKAAAYAFDAAQREVAGRQRPWHRALIAQRAGRFYLAHGMDRAGHALLAEARREYVRWGATAKVDQLDWAYPALQAKPGAAEEEPADLPTETTNQSGSTAREIDLLGIFAAAQALSSETSIDGLQTRLVAVLSAMTGATGVHLLVWNDDEQNWLLPAPGHGVGAMAPIDDAGRQLLPLSVVRYVERTREPLVVDDATRDDRFARDPYLDGVNHCSLLVVPILSRGQVQAMLLLENNLIRSAFSTDRLDGVMLIAGQLAVSLDNALVYASMERKVAERTAELALANERLEQLTITDPLTGLANRRRLENGLTAEWRRAQRLGETVSLAMVDIDHFKLYNDHHGHAAGDRCLQRVAAELSRNTRDIDLVARYGGEEFAIVMPDTDIDAALDVGERIRTAIASLAEPHTLVAEQIVTISVGIAATNPSPSGTAQLLVEMADAELYQAKRAGRNQVHPARPPSAV